MSVDPFGVCLEPKCNDEQAPLPSTIDMMKSVLTAGKDIIAGKLNGEDVLVNEETKENRLSICHACEFFIMKTNRCNQCGCFMEAKSMFNKVSCPIGKW